MKLLVASLLLAAASFTQAADYRGADAILRQVEEQSGTKPPTAPKPGVWQTFRTDLAAFVEHSPALSPDDAAREWIALFDRATKLRPPPTERVYTSAPPALLLETFQTLPPPSGWDALAAQIAARPPTDDLADAVLRVIGGMLANKPDAVRETLSGMDAAVNSPKRRLLLDLEAAFFKLTGDKAGALKTFEAQLALPKVSSGITADGDYVPYESRFEVPDLVTLAGPEKAAALLKQTFNLKSSDPRINGQKTEELARKVALENGETLPSPPWSLVRNLHSAALYEILARRFPDDSSYDRRQADAYYLLGLVADGRTDDAIAQATKISATAKDDDFSLGSLPDDALRELSAKGFAKSVSEFFRRLLAAHPELPYWRNYTEAAVLAGETDALLADLKAASERSNLKPDTAHDLRHAYGDALLAVDRVPEALAILREPAPELAPSDDNRARQQARAALRLVTLGQLLDDAALANEQLDALVKIVKAHPDVLAYQYTEYNDAFLAAGRGPEMEGLLCDLLVGKAQEEAHRLAAHSYSVDRSREILSALTSLYVRAGRYPDAVALLDHAGKWRADDLEKLINPESYSAQREFGIEAARALQKTGHADAALRTVNAFLEKRGGADSAYALLLELLSPDAAEARLNALFQNDQFEERPLIWKASLQLSQGRVEAAEKSARQAIAIDPSDGEEGRGDRMRAYAVLGDILERKGDGAKAGEMRQAVKAIRLSEDADRFHSAGLLTRAVAMYKQALGYFSDAYCIQSRLAIQLTAMGQFEEAMTHYQRAYELMPESFGRMESHCFGCERAFAGERAQGAAERVFNKLVTEQPANPRVHYLLGYLRKEQDRDADAAREFREAVRLDPDYINAWKQLSAVTDLPADREGAALNLLRLDPRRRHDSADLNAIGNLRALWTGVETAAKFAAPEAGIVYPLAASKAAEEKERQAQPAKPSSSGGENPTTTAIIQTWGQSSDENFTPRLALLKHTVVGKALQLLRQPRRTDE